MSKNNNKEKEQRRFPIAKIVASKSSWLSGSWLSFDQVTGTVTTDQRRLP
jgi:hypothetical protein